MDEHSEGSYLTVRMEAFLDCVNSRLAQAEPILNPATQDASHDG
jgi:hypothetical protein